MPLTVTEELAAPPPDARRSRARAALPGLALFAGAALISGFTMLRGLDPFDEGLMLQAARRVAGGELPYRDFLWSYGPGQPYLLGGLFEAFGVSLLHWRVLRVLTDAAIACVVYALVRRHTGPGPALLAWLTAATAMAQPRSANPFPLALLFALLAVMVITARGGPSVRRIAAAALFIALAAAWRLDFGIYAGGAVVAAILVMAGSARERSRSAGLCAALAAGFTLVAYLPFLIADGPADVYDALVATSLREKEWWTLPFPFGYDGSFRGWPPGELLEDVKDVLGFYVPLLLVIGLALALVLAVRRRRALPPEVAALGVLSLGGLAYLLSRTDEFHVTPLLVVLAALLPALAVPELRSARALAYPAIAVFALLLVHGSWTRASALLRPPDLDGVDVAVADGAKAPPEEAAALERVVALIQDRVPEDEPIYVAPLRSDLVALNNPLLYVLAERDNASELDFGLLAEPDEQRRTVANLEGTRPPLVIRWTDPISARREDNKRGRSTGDRTVDEYLAANYELLERVGEYELLVPRR